MVLLSSDPQELTMMLITMDQVAREYGMTIIAAKTTEIQVQQPAKGGAVPVPEVKLPVLGSSASLPLRVGSRW